MQPMASGNAPGMIIQKLEGKVDYNAREYVADKDASTPEKKRFKMQDSIKRKDAGYLITFPLKGHSIRVDEDEMIRLRDRHQHADGTVASETTGVDMTQVLRSSGGGSLVTVIMEGSK